jgi:hypothetical protein
MGTNSAAIDFIAHHSIQAQSLSAIAELMSANYDVRMLTGPQVSPTDAATAVVVDHLGYQPGATKRNYVTLVHGSHDIADLDVYRVERPRLKEFDLILCPGLEHQRVVERVLPRVESRAVGWPKFSTDRSLSDHPNPMAEESIILALTEVASANWRGMVDALASSGFHVYVKNHIYYDRDLGQSPPPGQEQEYAFHMRELDSMGAYLQGADFANIEVVDPRTNICDLFPKARTLITDWSSAAIEFTPFGVSIETGRVIDWTHGPGTQVSRENSLLMKEVRYVPESRLIASLAKWTAEDIRQLPEAGDAKSSWRDLCQSTVMSAAENSAVFIDSVITSRASRGADSFLKHITDRSPIRCRRYA